MPKRFGKSAFLWALPNNIKSLPFALQSLPGKMKSAARLRDRS
jgi:hypothetical protein